MSVFYKTDKKKTHQRKIAYQLLFAVCNIKLNILNDACLNKKKINVYLFI